MPTVHFQTIATRWMDNDVYGHVNNVVYYSYFDTVVNQYLIEQRVLDIEKSKVIGLVVETECHYFAPFIFPDVVHAGLRVGKLGNSSVRYEIGLFRNDEKTSLGARTFRPCVRRSRLAPLHRGARRYARGAGETFDLGRNSTQLTDNGVSVSHSSERSVSALRRHSSSSKAVAQCPA